MLYHNQNLEFILTFKDIYFVIYGIISDFTDKGQFQYLTNLKGPQEGTYLYTLGQVWYLIVSIPDLCNLITLITCIQHNFFH